jgi:hypothetical protein
LGAFFDDLVDVIHCLGILLKLFLIDLLEEVKRAHRQDHITILTLLDVIEEAVFEIFIIPVDLYLHFR